MAALMDVSVEQVTTLDQLVDLAVDLERSISSMQAARDGVLALAARWASGVARDADEAELSARTVAAELAAALHVSDRTVQRRMADAEFMVDRFAAVWQAQGTGRISAAHARVIVDAGERLDDEQDRAGYCAQAVQLAQDVSPNRLRPRVERLAEQYQPRTLEDRHREARKKRGAWVTECPDAMAELHVHGPAALVHGAFDRITEMAKTVGSASAPEDSRTLGHRRSDLALDLLLTGTPTGHDTDTALLSNITAHVSITIPATTLIDADLPGSPPADLNGRCLVDAGTARLLAGAATGWDRLFTHPITGALLAVDRYRPSRQLRRHLRARDQHCRFPGCRIPTRDSDLDHTLDAALGGATDDSNLGTLCRRHHVLKHHTPWHVEQLPNGLLEWTSPTGRTYTDEPPPPNTITFTDHAHADPPAAPPEPRAPF